MTNLPMAMLFNQPIVKFVHSCDQRNLGEQTFYALQDID